MEDLLAEISDDVNRYLNLKELTTVSTVSTNTLFRGLNNMEYYRFIPKENEEEILRILVASDRERVIGEKVMISDIKETSDVNFADSVKRTLLYWVVYYNDIEKAKLQIKQGANVNTSDLFGWAPLHLASMRDNLMMVKLLIKEGADINVPEEKGRTPLRWAIYNNDIHIAKLLIKEGADVNIVDNDGETPLHMAVNENNTEMIELLENAGAR